MSISSVFEGVGMRMRRRSNLHKTTRLSEGYIEEECVKCAIKASRASKEDTPSLRRPLREALGEPSPHLRSQHGSTFVSSIEIGGAGQVSVKNLHCCLSTREG